MTIAKNDLPRLEEVWIVISVDADGNEGLCGMTTAQGWMPLVAAHPRMLPRFKQLAAEIAVAGGCITRLARYTTRDLIDEWDGRQSDDDTRQ